MSLSDSKGKLKTKVLNLYGGPGTGKTTTGADLFTKLKIRHTNCELVKEYIKDWVWEGRNINSYDQVYILAKQARREQILYGSVDVVITDAPMWLSPIYESKYGAGPYICNEIVMKFQKEAESRGVEFVHIFLRRVKPYRAEGRYQNEEEAKVIDQEIKDYLVQAQLPFIEVDADESAAEKIIEMLKL